MENKSEIELFNCRLDAFQLYKDIYKTCDITFDGRLILIYSKQGDSPSTILEIYLIKDNNFLIYTKYVNQIKFEIEKVDKVKLMLKIGLSEEHIKELLEMQRKIVSLKVE